MGGEGDRQAGAGRGRQGQLRSRIVSAGDGREVDGLRGDFDGDALGGLRGGGVGCVAELIGGHHHSASAGDGERAAGQRGRAGEDAEGD